jgi:class 3 adenylate cyclase
VVDSTQTAASVGDRRWREALDEHDALIAEQLELHRGILVHGTGDGVLATFDAPARAVQCAKAIRSGLHALQLDSRIGNHTGEIQRRGTDIAGIAVHIAARIMALAHDGEILVSRTVRDLVVGSGLTFSDRGDHALKGVPDTWQLLAVEE